MCFTNDIWSQLWWLVTWRPRPGYQSNMCVDGMLILVHIEAPNTCIFQRWEHWVILFVCANGTDWFCRIIAASCKWCMKWKIPVQCTERIYTVLCNHWLHCWAICFNISFRHIVVFWWVISRCLPLAKGTDFLYIYFLNEFQSCFLKINRMLDFRGFDL